VAARRNELPTRMWFEAARHSVRIALDSVAAVFIPSDCRICAQPLVRISRIPVCDDCLNSLAPADVVACVVCGEALEFAAAEAALCPMCQRTHPRFDFSISYGAYDGALRKLLHLLKYEQLRPAAKLIGARLAQAIQLAASCGKLEVEAPEVELREAGRVPRNPVLVIPVPLHRAKRRQRGFNQSELLARSALRHLDGSRFELHIGNLRRVRATVSQTGLTRHQRRENVRGAFVVTAPERVRDRSVLIVDDVYTTGTTLNECARVLRAAGARRVVVATVARVYRQTVVGFVQVETQQHAASFEGLQKAQQAAKAIAG
jgi:ComF family protein